MSINRISCLKSLLNDQADFMIAEPEDLMVIGMTKANNNKVLITHELRVWEKGKIVSVLSSSCTFIKKKRTKTFENITFVNLYLKSDCTFVVHGEDEFTHENSQV